MQCDPTRFAAIATFPANEVTAQETLSTPNKLLIHSPPWVEEAEKESVKKNWAERCFAAVSK